MGKNNGGPAFPLTMEESVLCAGRFEAGYGGMTLHDYFAAKAMQGFCSQACPTEQHHFDNIANDAYRMADAMLKAQESQNG